MQCHKEADGNKAVGIDEITKREYSENLEGNIENLVDRLKRKSYKPMPSLRVYIPKSNGKMRPLGIACYEDKIVQLALKKILEAIYEPKFLNCMHGFSANRRCHTAVKELYDRINIGKITRVVDADIKGFFDHMKHEWILKFLNYYIKDKNILRLVKKYLKAGIIDNGQLVKSDEGTAQGKYYQSSACKYLYAQCFDVMVSIYYCPKSVKGECFLVVYADDFIAGFQYPWEAEKGFMSSSEAEWQSLGLNWKKTKVE